MPTSTRWLRVGVALLAICAASMLSCAQNHDKVPGPPPFSEAEIFLVPLGNVGPNDLNALAAHYRQTLGLRVVVGPAIPVDHSLYDPFRRQYIAESLAARVSLRSRSFAGGTDSHIIAITHEPMYTEANGRAFSFAFRGGKRLAVVSSAYMDTTRVGRPTSDEQVAVRARKTVSKTIGILHYELSLSRNPESVLYGGIYRPEDIDRVDETSLKRAIDGKNKETLP
jgi:predicted Zn-dependent protease